MERNYVIVCNRHKGIAGSLLFWGRYTQDDENRSYGGYTSDFNSCEKYTKEELKLRKDYDFNIYTSDNLNNENWRKWDDFIIHIDKLKELDYRPMMIYYR